MQSKNGRFMQLNKKYILEDGMPAVNFSYHQAGFWWLVDRKFEFRKAAYRGQYIRKTPGLRVDSSVASNVKRLENTTILRIIGGTFV